MTFIFSCTSGVRQFYLVLWLLEINGRIEEPGMEEMASANVKHGQAVIDTSVLMEHLCRSRSMERSMLRGPEPLCRNGCLLNLNQKCRLVA